MRFPDYVAGASVVVIVGVLGLIFIATLTPPKPTVEVKYRLADPHCKSYIAIPGEPCEDGLNLDVDEMASFRKAPPRDTLCSCQMVEDK
jgi:hypothetical protein